MARLIYPANLSLDGCTEDANGAVDWAPPDDEVFDAITELMASAGTYLYGRRMYETMAVWETDPALAELSDRAAAYATTWQTAAKIVFSTSLSAPCTANTQLERSFDPAAIERLKAASSTDLVIGGPNLAAQALRSGLVDEVRLFLWPVVLGGRNPAFAPLGRIDHELIDVRRFPSGVLQLRYQVS